MGKNAPKNSPLRAINGRRTAAVERLEERLKLKNEDLAKDAKRFRGVESVSEEDFNKYRAYLKKTLENTKKNISA